MRILNLFLVVLGAILLLWVAFDHAPLLVQLFGKSVEGKITSKDVKFHGSEQEAESGLLTLYYEFTAGGALHKGNETVPRHVYDAAEPGKPVTVRYLESRPVMNFPDGYLGQSVRGLPLLIAGFVCFATGFFLMRRTATGH